MLLLKLSLKGVKNQGLLAKRITTIIHSTMDRNFYKILCYAAILGDVLFILWISFNAIDEGFKGTIYQKVSFLG